ncbi:MAG: CBS domain-containing protein [Thermobacillus sp.]|uniref:CBS domain-containing protein n=1 Tax=Thermobacillus composti (strain DSM 18247 / JCM 13945 / KWC4) TaxID=717605 RepID=L0EDI4_THECK|nr:MULTISPECIES: CBS domain-containing protein [Thermobacillus]AGA58323.1 CBS domain-containing protein [Thermobacillus composti KWC4]REK58514.1 MAG: CBS domain-containing protein [Thermobacillus sp.]
MAKTVKEIMSTNTVTATTQDNIYECAVLMKQHDIGFVPIVEGRKLVGVVTDRDLVIRGYAEKHSGSTSVTEVMTKDIRTVPSSMTVDECARLMADNQIRRLPVVEDGELVGVVAIGDLAIREIFVNEAGDALSAISEHEHREPSAVH